MHVSGDDTGFQFMQYVSFIGDEGGKYLLALARACTQMRATAARQELWTTLKPAGTADPRFGMQGERYVCSAGLGKRKVTWEWVLAEVMERMKVLLQSAEEGWNCSPDLGTDLCLGNLGAATSPASGIAFYC